MLTKESIASVKRMYPVGKRVRLVYTSDPYTDIRMGELGTVSFVDDTGTIFVDWDCGSRLGMIYGEDSISYVG